MAKGKTEVSSVEFRPAKGGIISETRTKTKRGGQGGGPDYDHENEPAVHATLEHAQKHLAATMGHHFGESEAAEPEAKE